MDKTEEVLKKIQTIKSLSKEFDDLVGEARKHNVLFFELWANDIAESCVSELNQMRIKLCVERGE